MQIKSWFGQNKPNRNPHVYNACTNSNTGWCLTPAYALLDKCVNSCFGWQCQNTVTKKSERKVPSLCKNKVQALWSQDFRNSLSFLQLIIPEQIKNSIIQKQNYPFLVLSFKLSTYPKQANKQSKKRGWDTRKPQKK